ncbi:MAG: cyclic nucleotide-binding domain-containing protein, partial [Actinomycetota bacterium]|nr:cyclic nucleotide-binding domain-containing protein [Actinomycetota bacterium]
PRGAERLVAALRDPGLEAAALEALPPHDRSPELDRYIRERRDLALADAAAARAIDRQGGEGADLLVWALGHRARERALHAVAAAGSAPQAAALAVAVENLRTDGAQRADALETLDAVGERELIRPLVSIWEGDQRVPGDGGAALAGALEDPDPIVRAAAVLATRDVGDTAVQAIARGKGRDGSTIVREAVSLMEGEAGMRSAGTLSIVERVLFLRGVPLFEGLSPDDLVRVAEAATEEWHRAGGVLAEEGEVGDELHIVIDGGIRVVLGSREIARRGVGEYVGEMAIVSDQPRMASLVAEEDTRTLTLDGARFRRILRERPDVGLAVMRVLCDRLRASDSRAAASADLP